jgi:hypothetical protein
MVVSAGTDVVSIGDDVIHPTGNIMREHSMVEVGAVSPQEPHVTFNPPFPSTPQVVLSIRDQNVGATYRGCGVEAKNITAPDLIIFRRAQRAGRVVRYLFLSV